MLALLETVEQGLDGDYTPNVHTRGAAEFRAALSSLASASRIAPWMQAILFEWAKADGNGYRDVTRIFRALWERLDESSQTIKSRRNHV